MLTDIDTAMLSVTYRRLGAAVRNGELTGYMINYTRVDTDELQVMMVGGDTVALYISGLAAFTNYSVQVAAVNINGTGPFSDSVIGLSGQDSEYNDYV